MLIGMNRFLTKEEIERLYGIPPAIRPTVLGKVQPVYRDENGEQYFVENDVDMAVDDYAASVIGRQPSESRPAAKGKPGRTNTTADIARYANELKAQGKTWKEICAACKGRFPGRTKGREQVRAIWSRQYGGKKS